MVPSAASAATIGGNDDLLTEILPLLIKERNDDLLTEILCLLRKERVPSAGGSDDLLTEILCLLRKERVPSASAAIIGGSDDLLTEILVLLSAKTVARLKSVSKHWSSLISSEFFTRLHVQNHGRRRRVESQHSFIMGHEDRRGEFFICHPTIKKLVRVSMPSPIKKQLCEYKLLQSWNGLLLISMKYFQEGKDRIDYVVFNPTTKQYRLLQLDGYRPRSLCLMCDPSKSECYKVVMVTSCIPWIYSVYDSATQEWSHDFEGGNPFTKGFLTSDAQLHNHIVAAIDQGLIYHISDSFLQFPDVYYNYLCDSNEHINLVQLKPFPEKNKLSFRVGMWAHGNEWVIVETRTLDFNFKKSSIVVWLLGMMREEGDQMLGMMREKGLQFLGMMREEGAEIKDAVFLFHVPGQLWIYKINSDDQGFKVLVDYRSDYSLVKDEWQFKLAYPFIHTFASV